MFLKKRKKILTKTGSDPPPMKKMLDFFFEGFPNPSFFGFPLFSLPYDKKLAFIFQTPWGLPCFGGLSKFLFYITIMSWHFYTRRSWEKSTLKLKSPMAKRKNMIRIKTFKASTTNIPSHFFLPAMQIGL